MNNNHSENMTGQDRDGASPAGTARPEPWSLSSGPGSIVAAAVAGIVATGAALASGELIAAFWSPNPSPVIAVANRVVDEAPAWFVEFGKSIFGLADKPALVAGTVVFSGLFGALLGVVGRRRMALAVAGFVAFGLLGLVAIAADAQGSAAAGIVMASLAVAVGVGVLWTLLSMVRAAALPTATGETDATVLEDPRQPAYSRRSFIGWAGGVGAASALGVVAARSIQARDSVNEARASVELDTAAAESVTSAVTEAEAGPVASTPGITPLVVPNDDFYLIDTALVKPQVDPESWTLTIKGMVDNELTINYDELLDRASTVAPVTLSCVSNEVGGGLVGNAVWQGVPLVDLLDEAGVQEGATQIASRSVDGWSCGFPTEAAYDGRTALVAVAMNGEPLPVRHGFPARLVVAGLYGYVSATKWLKEIELTTLEAFDGYWIPRGWSKDGPIKTQSRIDTPDNGERVTAGQQLAVAGVAWAPDTGVDRVEVQIDDGEWQEATLGESLGVDAWRQWLLAWKPTPGRHTIRVRATDSSGYTQTSETAPPAPDGATGWHTIDVEAA